MPHVLVVEDDEDVRTVLHTGLEASGFRVSAASHGRDALALVDRDRPDVVLTDVMMPEMLGVDLVPRLVQRDIPVLVMTGIPEARNHLDDVGWRHIEKPVRLQALLIELDSVLKDAAQNLRMTQDTFARSRKARAKLELGPTDRTPSASIAADWSDRTSIIEQFELLRLLDDDSRAYLASSACGRRVSAGETIYSPHSPVANLFGILAGTVKVVLRSHNGQEIALRHLTAGDILGEDALFTGEERWAEAVATTKCHLLELQRRDLLHVLERSPPFCLGLLEFLCGRLCETIDYAAEASLLGSRARIARAILRRAKWPSRAPLPKISIVQRELAEIVGTSREYVNKILKEWERSSIVRLQGSSIYLLAPEKLARIAVLI
jgi:CRP/FNR family transcriptional regulator, cyclic AMP receptor protein